MEIRPVCPKCGSPEIERHWTTNDYHGSHIIYYWTCKNCNEDFNQPISSEEFHDARRQVRVEAAAEDMYKALKQIAEMDPGEHEVELAHDQIITTDCVVCEELIELARKTLKKAGLLED